MANFLIQTIDGQVKHDFSFALIEAIEYQNWLNEGTHTYELIELEDILEHDFTGYIPSGTVQFVQEYLDLYHEITHIRPINIPNELLRDEYLKRNITYKLKGSYIFDKDKFVKSDTEIKGVTEITRNLDIPDDGRYLVSDVIDIDSEWRAFVFNGKLVGLKNYLGDFTLMPDVSLVIKMIKDYKESPPAYTLDVGVNLKDETFLIEAHNFFSCGTYGFSDNRILPQMFASSFRHLIKYRF